MPADDEGKKANGNRMPSIIGWGYTVAIILAAL